jgi:2-keto-4-pentenoate hydratase/2-oxohepta-3-ene-1,7-dioic acid hydratase in catechol pathway
MKIARFSVGSRQGLGLVVGDRLIDLTNRFPASCTTMMDLIENWNELSEKLQFLANSATDLALSEVVLRAPIARPGKIMGIGLNYSDHAAESKMELPEDQLWFSKAVTSVTDPFGVVQLPRVSTSLDYEAELVFVIGKKCRHVLRDQAAAVIFGYCIGNDVSVRDWQFKTSQFILGKSFDTHAPIGPWIVTSEAIDPHNLDIRCLVNGDERQSSNTQHFIFDCYAMVEHLSKVMTLEPGDVIFTGTPAGVGAARKPPLWLREGDVVRIEIDGIGAIENRIVRE